jgi:prolyl 4-hydroxylase
MPGRLRPYARAMLPSDPRHAAVAQLAQSGRIDEAVALLNQLALEGDAMSLFTLANFHWQGGGPTPHDPVLARDYFRRAGEAGHGRAAIIYTNLLANGVYGPADWSQALERLQREAAGIPEREPVRALIERMDIDANGDPRALPAGEQLSEQLEVTLFRGLFTAQECDYLMAVAQPIYQPSMINDTDGREIPHPLRSSDGAPLSWALEDPAIHALNRRLAAVTGVPAENAEPLLILRYRPGQQYTRHFDALPSLENQRLKTALVYLNDGYEGGKTEFPRLGLKIRGRRGDVLVFRNIDAEGATLPMSEHAGLPVTGGVKYLASRWIRVARHAP